MSRQKLGERVLEVLAPRVQADVGVFFARDPEGWRRAAYRGLDPRDGPETFGRSDGLVGQAAQSGELVRLGHAPPGELKMRSGTAEGHPAEIVLVPAFLEGVAHAVVELAFLRPPQERSIRLLERVGETIAIAVRWSADRVKLKDLLEESQRQTEELQTQQEELLVANDELTEQRSALQEAQALLEERQGELEAVNVRLEENALALQDAEKEVRTKATELERTSRYKSEFLANMSHELRTPLNSSLILAKLLAENKDGNLNEEQVRFAQTIGAAGHDLLLLINDVLDLSKIEAGMLVLDVTEVRLARVTQGLGRAMEPLAQEKGLSFLVEHDGSAPLSIQTDQHRLEQILRNLLSNAIKFTEKGGVTLRVAGAGALVTFSVRDTGIGIPKPQQAIIFEAFRQVDAASNRAYGGTGLGLSISRDLATLLGGAITVESEEGKGSVFALTLPLVAPAGTDSSLLGETRALMPREPSREFFSKEATTGAARLRRSRTTARRSTRLGGSCS